jgi:hypothetical protein
MQRNLRPPLFTRMNFIGLPHFLQAGGGVFLAMGKLALNQAGAQNSQSPITAEAGTMMIHHAHLASKIASQFG